MTEGRIREFTYVRLRNPQNLHFLQHFDSIGQLAAALASRNPKAPLILAANASARAGLAHHTSLEKTNQTPTLLASLRQATSTMAASIEFKSILAEI